MDVVYAFLNARYYDGRNGKFLSQDPILLGAPGTKLLLNPQSLNYYSYASNNPVTSSDPSGLMTIPGGQVEWGDTAVSIANQLNGAYGAQYGVYFTGDRLLEFNGGKQPVLGGYYSFSIDLGNKYAINGSGYSGGGGNYVGGETNVGSTAAYSSNEVNGTTVQRFDITGSLMGMMRYNARDPHINNPWYFKSKVQTGGDWDLKNVPGGPYNSADNPNGFVFMGKWITKDDPGNIHFGYVGDAASWSTPEILRSGAALYQNYSDIRRGEQTKFLQDNPGDTRAINLGIILHQLNIE